MACFRVFRQQQDGYDGGSRRGMEDRSRSASPPVAVTNREFQGIAVNDQDLPETITKTTRGIADLVEKSADLDHESVADEPLEKEFACHIATDFDDGDPADDDDEEISAAQMKNKLEQFFADDPLTEAIDAFFADTGIAIEPFSHDQAVTAGGFAAKTRKASLSLGDRACLALGAAHSVDVLTADHTWEAVADDLGIAITLLR